MSEEPYRKRQRVTPRQSLAAQAQEDVETPITQLRQLAAISRQSQTPAQRTPRYISLQTPGSRALNSTRRTPTSAIPARTPTTNANIRSQRPAKQGPPTTPHAIRALQQRRNATPGRQYDNRRKSGLQQRETPQNDLRALGKALARNAGPRQIKEEEQSEPEDRRPRLSAAIREAEEPLEPAPRLSIPLHDRDDDNSWDFTAAPRISLIRNEYDDEDLTVKSVEAGRRALLDERRRLSQETVRALGQVGVDLDEDELTGDLDAAQGNATFDLEEDDIEGGYDVGFESGEETGELRAMLNRNRRDSRPSGGFELGASPDTDGEPTFVFRIPEQRRRSTIVLPVAADSPAGLGPEEEADATMPVVSIEDEHAENDVNDESQEHAGQEAEDSGSSDGEEEPQIHQSSRRLSNRGLPGPITTTIDKGTAKAREPAGPKPKFISAHGLTYSSFPSSVVKKLASTFTRTHGGGKTKIDKETLAELSQATDWFFEQVSEDLAAYAGHAKRKTIDESDVVMLMKRQKQITPSVTPFALATRLLPRELMKEFNTTSRKQKTAKSSGAKRKRVETDVS